MRRCLRREHQVGMLRAQIEKDVAEADGMFGGAAKERMALVQTFLDAFETTLPEMGVFDEIKHASLGVVVVDPAVQVLKAKPSAADGAAAGRPTLSPAAQPKAAPSGSTAEERHLNELTEQLEAMESKLQALEGKDKSNVDALAAKERRIAELEARLADLELQKPGARNGESPAATRENTVKKSKRAKEKASSLPLKSPKDEAKKAKTRGGRFSTQLWSRLGERKAGEEAFDGGADGDVQSMSGFTTVYAVDSVCVTGCAVFSCTLFNFELSSFGARESVLECTYARF